MAEQFSVGLGSILRRGFGVIEESGKPLPEVTPNSSKYRGGEEFVRNLLIVIQLHVIVNLLSSKLSKVFISMDDANLVEKLDLKHSCFGKALLLEWRNGKTCCHACFTEYGKVEIFFKNGLYIHYRSLHR